MRVPEPRPVWRRAIGCGGARPSRGGAERERRLVSARPVPARYRLLWRCGAAVARPRPEAAGCSAGFGVATAAGSSSRTPGCRRRSSLALGSASSARSCRRPRVCSARSPKCCRCSLDPTTTPFAAVPCCTCSGASWRQPKGRSMWPRTTTTAVRSRTTSTGCCGACRAHAEDAAGNVEKLTHERSIE